MQSGNLAAATIRQHPSLWQRIVLSTDIFPAELRDAVAACFVVHGSLARRFPIEPGKVATLRRMTDDWDCIKNILPHSVKSDAQSHCLHYMELPLVWFWALVTLCHVSPNWNKSARQALTDSAPYHTAGGIGPIDLPMAEVEGMPHVLDEAMLYPWRNGSVMIFRPRVLKVPHFLSLEVRNSDVDATWDASMPFSSAAEDVLTQLGTVSLRGVSVSETYYHRFSNDSGLWFVRRAIKAGCIASTTGGACSIADVRVSIGSLERANLVLAEFPPTAAANIKHLKVDIRQHTLPDSGSHDSIVTFLGFIRLCAKLESLSFVGALCPSPLGATPVACGLGAFENLRTLHISHAGLTSQALLTMLVPSLHRLVLDDIIMQCGPADSSSSWSDVFQHAQRQLPRLELVLLAELTYGPSHPRYSGRPVPLSGFIIATNSSVPDNDDMDSVVALVETIVGRLRDMSEKTYILKAFSYLDRNAMAGQKPHSV